MSEFLDDTRPEFPYFIDFCPPYQDGARPPKPKVIHEDFSMESILRCFVQGSPKSAALMTDEGGLLFHGHNLKGDTAGATLAAMVKLFDDGKGERSRLSDPEGSGSFFGAAFTASVSCQPVAARTALNDDLQTGQGFLARFLLAYPQPQAGDRSETIERLNTKPEHDKRLQTYWDRLSELAFKPPKFDFYGGLSRQTLTFSREALEVWLRLYNAYEKEQGKGGKYSGKLKPFAGRFGEQVFRVATVLAVFNGLTEIDKQTMTDAIRVVSYSLGQWKQALEGSGADKTTANASALLEWLRANKEHRTLSSVYQKSPKPCDCRTKHKAMALLAHLRDFDWVRTGDTFKTFRVWGDDHA